MSASEASPALTVALLDALPASEVAALLASCCGAEAWVLAMVARRPFGTRDALLAAADEVWWSLAPDDWREAFAHHPRIGEREPPGGAGRVQDERARRWSADEQRGASAGARADAADDGARALLAEANRVYERRFGHVYLVCATGRSARELLDDLRSRLANDPATELRVAAGEQAKITRLRLAKLLNG